MCLFEENSKNIVVSPREYFPILFSFKEKNSSLNIKIIDKKDFLGKISFSFSKDPIPLLIKNGIDYSRAKKYIHIFLTGDLNKNPSVKKLFSLIPSDYISKDEYGLFELQHANIFFFEMNEDIELPSLCIRNNLPYRHINFSDLNILPENKIEDVPQIIYFPNKISQFFYIYAQIRERILKNDEDKKRIRILTNNKADLYYLELCSSLFDIPTIYVSDVPFNTVKAVKEKMKQIHDNESFAFTDKEKEDSSLNALAGLIDRYGLDSLNDFSYAYANLLEIVSSNKFREASSNKGIIATGDFAIENDTDVYVTSFEHDTFYNVQSDKDVLSDKELFEMSVNPSYIKTALDRRLKGNYLQYSSISLLSLAKQHLTDKIFDSQFIEEFNWKSGIVQYQDNAEGVYTSKANKLYQSDKYDKEFVPIDKRNEEIYDHSFKGISEHIDNKKDHYSLTKLESYIRCPYKYYLSDFLKTKDDDHHSRWRGTLIHSLMENAYNRNYDFESEWSRAEEGYKKNVERDGFVFDEKEEAFLSILKFHLEKVISSYRQAIIDTDMQLVHEGEDDSKKSPSSEVNVVFTLKDNNEREYKFVGKIDKIMLTEHLTFEGGEKSSKRYYTIIDYKSGNETFIPTDTYFGLSVQLPLYYYALSKLDVSYPQNLKAINLIQDSIFGGFGIKKVYNSTPKGLYADDDGKISSESLLKNTKVRGLSLNSLDYFSSFDCTSISEKDPSKLSLWGGKVLSKSKTSLFVSNENDSPENILGSDSSLDRYNLSDLVDDCISSMISNINKIENNEFTIAPTVMSKLKNFNKNNLQCSYCPYRDICYRSPNDIKQYGADILKHYALSK